MMRLIAAVDSQLGMSTDDGIPWDLPTDRQFFKDQIAQGVILMGYQTYVEVLEPLHDRINYVATRRDVELREGFAKVSDIEAFLAKHHGEVIQNIGGPGLFRSTMAQAQELVLTRIHADFSCTKFFPAFADDFYLRHEDDPIHENGVTFTYQYWNRKND